MAEPRLSPEFLTVPIAHRALHDRAAGRIENSLAAVSAAVTAGYGIEVDIQRSRDGKAMVFHDYDLARLTGRNGAMTDLTADELSGLTLTGGSDTVPTLKAVLSEIRGQVPILIEIKDQDRTLGSDIGPLERAVAADLEGYEGPAAIMSFNPHSVAEFSKAAPARPRGLTTDPFDPKDWTGVPPDRLRHLAGIADFEAVGASFISHHRLHLADAPVVALKSRGVPVLTWTIRSPEQEAEARRIADNITFEGYLPPIGH